MNVLMISGDTNIFRKGSVAHARLELQRAQVEELTVLAPRPGEWKIAAMRRILREGRAIKADIVTAQDPFFLGLVAWRIAGMLGVPLQLQIHSDMFSPSFARRHRFKTRLAAFLLSRAAGVRVVSDRIKQSLVPLHMRAPISVLPVFVDLDAVREAPRTDFRASYPQFSKTILIASRLEAEKRVDDLLRSVPAILHAFPDAGVFVAGDGSERARLGALSQTLGIDRSVVFLGYRDDILSLYKGADLCLAATALHEGFGEGTVQALAAGCPVVSLDAGVAKEAGATIVSPGEMAEAAIAVLRSGGRGGLKMRLQSADEWGRAWRASLEACLSSR